MEEIIKRYSLACGFTVEEITGKRRDIDISAARQAIWVKLSKRRYPKIKIGQVFNRNHSTIIRGIEEAQRLIEVRDELILWYDAILEADDAKIVQNRHCNSLP